VTIPAALAAFDLTTKSSQGDQHALAVDVAYPERRHLGDPQPRAIGDAKGRPVLEAGGGTQQTRHLLGAEHHRQLARIRNADELAGEFRPVEGGGEEEAKCCHGAVHRRRVHAPLGLMHLEPADILGRRRIRRPAQECSEAGDDANVVAAGLLGKPAHRHVLDQALTQAAAGRRRR